MKMNRVDGAGVGRASQAAAARDGQLKDSPAKAGKSERPAADSIDLSDAARRLAEQPSQGEDRAGRVEAARRKLTSGELDTPQAAARAAEKLLRSGDLNGSDDAG